MIHNDDHDDFGGLHRDLRALELGMIAGNALAGLTATLTVAVAA